jgi:preprotein translocase subunit YajC
MLFISPAYAQAAGGVGGGGFEMFLPFILIFVVFYFLMIRPQQKKAKAHRAMLENLGRGDRIVTGGGIIGKVTRVEGPTELLVEIAPNLRVRVLRSTVSELTAQTQPAANDDAKGGGDDDGGSMKKGRKRTADKDGGDDDGGSLKKGRKPTVDKDG